MEVLSASRGRGADRRWGLGASYGLKVREDTGWLSLPQSVTAFRFSSMVLDLEFLCLLRINAL